LHRAIRKGNGFEPFWEFQVAEMNKSAPLTLRDGLRRKLCAFNEANAF